MKSTQKQNNYKMFLMWTNPMAAPSQLLQYENIFHLCCSLYETHKVPLLVIEAVLSTSFKNHEKLA